MKKLALLKLTLIAVTLVTAVVANPAPGETGPTVYCFDEGHMCHVYLEEEELHFGNYIII